MHGATLYSLFFTVLGTILGGIWADQSWGRFWGWDPKENGAMLICLMLLFVLHGRLAGYFTPKLYAAGLVMTGIVVSLAWFGVNLLNVGLHSYGFTDSIAYNLLAFGVIEIIFAGVFLYLTYKPKGNKK
jgi:ABC-type transport system involved in cytochrome c biogenesis permease subunit